MNIIVIIPAYNEEAAIGKVIAEIPKSSVREVVVANNRSTDQTALRAQEAGATVVYEPISGYGRACLRAMEYVESLDVAPDIIVFLDGDHSDYPEELPKLVHPITDQGYDMVIGSRALGQRERGSMTPPQIFGNWLATFLIKHLYNVHYTDLGPFRAIKWPQLLALNMQDKNYGWTVEMQIKAAKQRLKSTEVAVKYRRRIGVSKVSGTVKGVILAGYKIITTIFKYW